MSNLKDYEWHSANLKQTSGRIVRKVCGECHKKAKA